MIVNAAAGQKQAAKPARIISKKTAVP